MHDVCVGKCIKLCTQHLRGYSINLAIFTIPIGCGLIRKHAEFASCAIENVLISVNWTVHLSG